MIIYVSLIVCLIGAVVFAVTENAKASALAIHAYWFGGLAFLLNGVQHVSLVTR